MNCERASSAPPNAQALDAVGGSEGVRLYSLHVLDLDPVTADEVRDDDPLLGHVYAHPRGKSDEEGHGRGDTKSEPEIDGGTGGDSECHPDDGTAH